MPYNRKPELTKEETEGFENYVRARYLHDLQEAESIAVQGYGDREGVKILIQSIFEKLATPRVFLIDEWRRLSDDERISYYPEDYQKKAKSEAEELSKKAGEMLSK